MKRKLGLYLLLIAAFAGLVLSIGAGVVRAQTDQPTPIPTGTVEHVPTASVHVGTAEPVPSATRPLEGVVSTRPPEPTATPGRLAKEVSDFTGFVGLAGKTFLGLTTDDWINLWISILAFLFAYLAGTWVIRRALPRAVRRTPTEFDNSLLKAVGPQVRWLVVLAILYIATRRLIFVSAGLKAFLNDLYFVLAVVVGLYIAWELIALAGQWNQERAASTRSEDEVAPLTTLLVRLARVVAVIAGLGILLNHFGVDVVAFAAALGIGGLALSLAARDTIADMIAGFIILLDRPFRIGDRIEIQGVGTWGDVVEIGLRTTRIRTRDNRMVIVPNSTIGTNEIVNYTYPDPEYRIETRVDISDDNNIETAEDVLVDAVRRVEGVLLDKPVEALYVERGDSAMIFRVRWWIESYEDTQRMFDRVHRSLQRALDEAGIESPDPTQKVSLDLEAGAANNLLEAIGGRGQSGPASGR